MVRKIKRIRTVLYGDQRLSSAELEVLHTPAMQRLYGLRQLGLTDRVFIDASHARIHHVVGVLHHVDKLVSAIIYNLRHSKRKLRVGSANDTTPKTFAARELAHYVRSRRPVIRFIGLLHDLTHAPFGHTLEDEIRLVDTKHDQPERQADAFYRLLCQLVAWLSLEAHGPEWEHFPDPLKPFLSQGAIAPLPSASDVGNVAHKLISELTDSKAGICLRLTPRYIAEMFAHLSCAMTGLLNLQVLHEQNPKEKDFPRASEYPFQQLIRVTLEGTEFKHLIEEYKFEPRRDAFMLDIVGNTVCADLLDYAGRDSHFAGLRLNYDPDRIAENFTLVEVDSSAYTTSHSHASGEGTQARGGDAESFRNPFKGWCLRAAISLVSHKFRTDVPSELMNLLNVRFYLYERVIFHPTKCAAGSMLGTALQLLGWRKDKSGSSPVLPPHLRFVGDDVFLHDICAALDLVVRAISLLPGKTQIEDRMVRDIAERDSAHSGLVPTLLELRVGQSAAEALVELRAAGLLLSRLASRRYFRPVFRALPSTKHAALQAGPETLAEYFREPDQRYKVERDIERRAGIPAGTITIHCPTRTTAKKIANVYLTKPDEDGVDQVRKLKDIGSLDKEIFGQHEAAVKAVEQMYGSMWRLTVYVAPEHLERWKEISVSAGRAIFEAVDVHRHFTDQPEQEWPNDPNLTRELAGKMVASFGDSVGEEDLTLFGDVLRQIGEELLSSDGLRQIPPSLYNPNEGLSDEGRRRIEEALVSALSRDGEKSIAGSPKTKPQPRADQVLTVVRGYIQRIKKDDVESFQQIYSTRLNQLPAVKFEEVLSKLQGAVDQSKEFDQHAPAHQGSKFNEFKELLDNLLGRIDGSGDLFGGQDK